MTDRGYLYTPKTHLRTPKITKTPLKCVQPIYTSDSEESVKSEKSSDADVTNLTLVAAFDEIMKLMETKRNDEAENYLINYNLQVRDMVVKLQSAMEDCCRLQKMLEIKNHEFSELECKLNHARVLLDNEKRLVRKVENEKCDLEAQIQRVREFLFKDSQTKFMDDAREQLAFLNSHPSYGWDPNIPVQDPKAGLNTIHEVNTTGSLLSDLSCSKSEDDLESSRLGWKKPRHSTGPSTQAIKKRRSSTNKVVEITNTDSVRATTTLTVPKNGPITATSIIESVPAQQVSEKAMEAEESPNIIYNMWQNQESNVKTKPALRQHNLVTKTTVMPELCGPCDKRIRFGRTALRCKDCKAVCHPECSQNLPVPCIPFVNTPTQRNFLNLISDYAPTTPPMVPALIVHCLNEIEARGLNEIGIYRIPGAERDVKLLKERFLKGKGGSPCLNQIDIHVICGCVKDFLRHLNEPLVTFALRPSFVRCAESKDTENIQAEMYKIMAELPQPNRDTLAYMMLHLNKIAASKQCKMPVANLAIIFAPTIVGFSSGDIGHANLLPETREQQQVMEHLFNIPDDYWASILNVEEENLVGTPKLQQIPSTDSLIIRSSNSNFFTPHSARRNMKRKQKFFPTPPSYK